MPKIFDTMTASHILDENLESNGLKHLTHTVLGVPEDEIKAYDEVTFGTPEFEQYAINDAVWTYQLYQVYSTQISKEGLGHLFYDIEMPFQKVLAQLEINGIKVDVSIAKQMTYDVRHLYYEIENTLLEFFGGQYNVGIMPKARRVFCKPSINFNSSDQVVPLIEGLGFEIYEKTKKKKKSWGVVTKKRLKGKHPMIDLLIKLGKVEKLLNGFLEPFETFVQADGRIRSSFHNTVCVTGRLSCSNPNIEQSPRESEICNFRNVFCADEDNVLIVADYGGQELRIMAEESHDYNMLKSLRAGLDIHLQTANDFNQLGLTIEQLMEGSAEHKEAKGKHKKHRDACKSVGFGIAYGKGAYGFAKDFGTTEEEAQEFIDKFLDKYPGLRQAIEKTKGQITKFGYVRNMSGRKRRFPGFAKLNKWGQARCFRQGFNFKIQSYGADTVKKAASEIIKNKLLRIVNLIHDEIIIECPKYYAEQGVAFVKECMIRALPISIPWTVEINYGFRYGACK